ncbi:Uncharacterized conserved protein YafD, endonuclease/exonuclease/phosphatase (EEP) superfamily [Catalinimonas alkaloidigena]|uniref:Uncharacterized conserved protein YafD, endonuclease/exonuclease/phosphatase (EEP) superfamily n=1 Tax=Catalinimonas alkaloidigena TaxID=1075417 RepID=A0A1G8Y8K7_9BACT|nr:endonuclease/exonuclease/phosphatase family protein [Catalinimonas alkaloidigena]SDJ99148.1 Uncharacterized conserved protein YafD, endonuclease/exonuclease/phosphatase (EEP) superfamily [Catalinimonas alkaloidigena]
MAKIKTALLFLIILLGLAAVAATLLSLLYDVPIWWLKVLDFPRLQLLLALAGLLVLYGVLNRHWRWGALLFVVALLLALGIQASFIVPYTPLGTRQVADAAIEEDTLSSVFSLLIANVYMKNRNAEALPALIRRMQPDVVLLLEVDAWWEQTLQPLDDAYPYGLEHPLDNTYGLILYSRLPLSETEVKHLNHHDVPSVHTTLQLPDGRSFRLHAVHPVPPIPDEYPDNMDDKEVALLKVGDLVVREQVPAVVAGDFNDVSWSHTTRMFEADDVLHNVRLGRGLFNSFDATSSLFRWPLDHVFVTREFRVKALQRMEPIGSDHFPVYVELVLSPR